MGKDNIEAAACRSDNGSDPEKQSVQDASTHELDRGFSSRHLMFLSIGSTIGTGLFIGSGSSLATAGPVSCVLAYLFIGTIMYSVMVSLGEMATYMPVPGSFTVYNSRFVDQGMGFAIGWLYWFSWAVTFALELTAAGMIIQYWNASINIGIWIAIFLVIFTATNFLPARLFGETEVWFASIKVVTIIGFIIFAICINAGASPQGYIGFKYWNSPGAFAPYNDSIPLATSKFVAFWDVLISAAFAYQGAELIGVGAGEAKDPHKTVPKAIRNTFWGILILFVGAIFFLGLLVPYDNPDLLSASGYSAAASPLVIAINLAGVPVLPHIINAVLLTAVLSAANSNVYSGSRILVALASVGQAPQFLTKTNKHQIPWVAVLATATPGLLAFLNLSAGGSTAFDWFLNITAVAGLICWASINLCHIRFQTGLKLQGVNRATLPYLAPFQPWLSWYGLSMLVLIILTQGFFAFVPVWDTVSFFTAYISLILFVIMYIGYWAVVRPGFADLRTVDLNKGRVYDESPVAVA